MSVNEDTWKKLGDVPPGLQKVQGAKLTLEQCNWVEQKARELSSSEGEMGRYFAKAREEFAKTFSLHPEYGIWV